MYNYLKVTYRTQFSSENNFIRKHTETTTCKVLAEARVVLEASIPRTFS